MKKITIPKLSTDVSDIAHVAQLLQTLPVHTIDTINWVETHPSKPQVTFAIAHTGSHILLQYRVKENEILAAVTDDNGRVWTDSCVEMFVSFDNAHYYNAEFTCIGKALLGYRRFGEKAQHAPADIMQSITRLPSLGTENRELQAGNWDWLLTLVIPQTAFWQSNLQSFSGMQARGNFYKCGDNLSTPHFVSWAAIDTPAPSFHQPKFFGELIFE